MSSSANSALLQTVSVPTAQVTAGSRAGCRLECRNLGLRFMVMTTNIDGSPNKDVCQCTNEALHDRVDCSSSTNVNKIKSTGLGFSPVAFSVDASDSPSDADFSDTVAGDIIDTSLIQVGFLRHEIS